MPNEEKILDQELCFQLYVASKEIIKNEYICYGDGNVICPSSGELVAGYYKKRNLE